ncbi:uncharacterized protein [Montipora foliosa]|uniref:uncharacterized protein isoform X3 n=1 Tax=Montipora foliosa TaxID=591990 RepID=UPI0035F1E768
MRKIKEGPLIYLALYALRDIMIGEELRYDYGVKDLPWRNLHAEESILVEHSYLLESAQEGANLNGGLSANLEVQSEKAKQNQVNVPFPINISTSPEISSMNQNNCISLKSYQRFQQWKPDLDKKECWINDEGINTYNAILAKKFQNMGKPVYIFSSFFLQRWKKFENCKRDILQSLCQVNLLEKEKWVIPVNHQAHWTVIIVNLVTKTMCLYDSIDNADGNDDKVTGHFHAIKNFANRVYKFWGKEWIPHDWKHCIVKETPKQCNAFDCGIFSLKFVEYVISEKALSFSQDDIPRFRQEMAREILIMGWRSEDVVDHQKKQNYPPVGKYVKSSSSNKPLTGEDYKNQQQQKDIKGEFGSAKEFVANSRSNAHSEKFDCAATSSVDDVIDDSLDIDSALTELISKSDIAEPDLSDDTDCEYEDCDKSSNEITDLEGTTSDPKSDEENVIEDENDDIQCSKSYKQNMKRRKRLFSGSSSDEDNMSHSAVPEKTRKQTRKCQKKSTKEGVHCSVNQSKMSVPCAKKNESNTRVYDKRQACFYCGVLVSKIARHYELKHKTERDVAIALSFNKRSPTRKKHLEKLRLLGNYHHNLNVLETGKGELIVFRRPTSGKECSPSDFLPCNYCLGFIRRQELWKHVKLCKFKPEGDEFPKHRKVQEKARLQLFPAIYSDSILCQLFATMKSDQISLIARNDWLIKEIGVLLIEKHGEKQNNFVSQKMRELARLLLQLRKTSFNADANLSDFIKPQEFDVVVSAVKALSKFQFDDGVHQVATPSLALKIGHSLKKCVNVLRGHALRRKDDSLLEDVDNFEKLIEAEWSHRVSHHSLRALGTQKFNRVELLPLAEDLEKLRKSVLSIMQSTAQVLQEGQPQLESWSKLAQATLARLVMFNKRRGGEASRMLLKSYLNRPDWNQVNNPEIMSTLSEFEKELSKRLDMVEIIGKRGKKVPVILTAEMTRSIDLLIKTREAVAIPEKNPFVFARPNRQSLQCMRAWDCLRNISMQCQPPLLNPANITSTKLRKYIATISQVLSMEEKEVDWLARHLGHDIRVHRDFYRLHESTIEIAKVSKLLLTVDQGETRKFAGKTLQEINLNDIAEPDLSDDTDYEDEDDVESSTETAEGTTSARSKETKSGKMCAKDPAERSVNSSMGKPAQGSNDPEKENTTSVNSAAKLPEKTRNQSRKCQKKSTKEGVHCSVKQSKKSVPHKPWTGEEKEAVLKYLGHWIRKGRVPGKLDCEQCISKANGALDHRKWTDLKYFVKNQIDKRKKVLDPKN